MFQLCINVCFFNLNLYQLLIVNIWEFYEVLVFFKGFNIGVVYIFIYSFFFCEFVVYEYKFILFDRGFVFIINYVGIIIVKVVVFLFWMFYYFYEMECIFRVNINYFVFFFFVDFFVLVLVFFCLYIFFQICLSMFVVFVYDIFLNFYVFYVLGLYFFYIFVDVYVLSLDSLY